MTKRLVLLLAFFGLVFVGGCFGPCLPPIASFTTCPDGSRGDLDVQFSSTSQSADGHGITFFEWDYGDGNQVDDYYGWTSHRYLKPGTYIVLLTITDDRGVKATVEQTVAVDTVVEVRNVAFSTGYPARAVGELANLSDLFLYSASVKVKFYDQDGVRVAEALIDIQSIDPGERVRFVAEAPNSVGAIASAVAFVQSFAAECSGGPIYPPIPMDGK
ncbi:MAG: PKD domain-containing protein [bacterium]